MSKLEKVLEILEESGVSCDLDLSPPREIQWIDGDIKYNIYECDIAEKEDALGWLQSSDNDDHLLVIHQKNSRLTWLPETYNPAFGCECIYIGWRGDFLIFIYLEKHDIYICKASNNTVEHFNFSGQDIFIGEDVVTYCSFGGIKKGKVSLIELESFNEVKKITIQEAEKNGTKPIYYQDLIG
ncbi:hypothetical protein ACG1BZ_06625 [Microbulbifer sp. CNSA002]|uniref:hypothetical protein n=1 Tax=Microbulbifer sp. CNSA002 TaxID=3373604 RepID=UPI0039B3CCEE